LGFRFVDEAEEEGVVEVEAWLNEEGRGVVRESGGG